MVFYLGLDDLLNLKNIERVKKDLKVIISHVYRVWFDYILMLDFQVCFPMIDTILDGLNPRDDWDDFCDITNCIDAISCPEHQTFEVFHQK